MAKKIVSVALVIITLFSTLAITASAAYENTHRNTGNQRQDIIAIAQTQVGYSEGKNNNNKYGAYFGNNNAPWCAYFVSWCARQAGISESILPTISYVPNYYKSSAFTIKKSGYTPKSGDLFITKTKSHVGFVWYVEGSYFYTIEGNSSDAVRTRKYAISKYHFAVPKYASHSHSYSSSVTKAATCYSTGIRTYRCSCGSSYTQTISKIQHNYSGKSVYKTAHPHEISIRCVNYSYCKSSKKTGKTKTVSSCSSCPIVVYIDNYYYLDLNSYVNGNYKGDINGVATADVYIDGKKVANDVTDFYQKVKYGSTYIIKDIRTKSGYTYNGKSSYSGKITSAVNINLSFSEKTTYFTTNFRMKSGTYTNAYSSYKLDSKVGRIYTNDLLTVKRVYSNGVVQVVCPWNNNGNKTVYAKISELKFKATKYINAYDSCGGSKVGRVYPNDIVSVLNIYSNGWMRVSCPWNNNGNRIIYIKSAEIY